MAGSDGVSVEVLPLHQPGRAAAVAVSAAGELHVVGRLGSAARRGFIAVRRKRGWHVSRRRSPVQAVIAHRRGALALDGDGLVYCGRRCSTGPRVPEPLFGLAQVRQGAQRVARIVANSGAIYALRGRRLRRTVAAPAYGYSLSRVVGGARGLLGLFGPSIRGSEYHPYCVASLVARLTAGSWQPIHRVAGQGGNALDCQSDDKRPPVVIDIAAAGGVVYARRRSAHAGVLPGYRPLPAAPPAAATP